MKVAGREKWAVKLTQEVKDWIEKEFKTSSYKFDSGFDFFYFPNYFDGKGFKKGWHTSSRVENDYTEVTLDQFLKAINLTEWKPKFGELVMAWDYDLIKLKAIYIGQSESEYPYLVLEHGVDFDKFKNGNAVTICPYKNISQIPPIETITLEEAEKELGKKIIINQ